MLYGNVLSLSNKQKAKLQLESECLKELESIDEAVDPETGKGGKLRPIFTVLLYGDSWFEHIAEKLVKDEKYWHSAIGFGPSLKKLYSFNFDEWDANKYKGGLSYESIEYYKEEHPTGTMFVGCLLVSEWKYREVKKALNYYIKNKKKTSYDFINLARAYFNKPTKDGMKFNLVCSTFVDTILKQANIRLNDKPMNLVKPDDLINEKNKQFKIFEGKIVDYDEKKAIKMVEKMVDDESLNFFGKKKGQ